MLVQPYLFFEGRCEEALEFYKKTLGAKVDMLMRYKDAPRVPSRRPSSAAAWCRRATRSCTPPSASAIPW